MEDGCAIAQVLMATGFVHVKTLHVLGGDAAVTDVDSQNQKSPVRNATTVPLRRRRW
jgi:hypothetical protein